MASVWLTYSGMSGGQHLTFKPTLMAALLASGFGSYLYYDPPVGGLPQESPAKRSDSGSGFDAGFYGSAKAAEPQVQVKFAATDTKADIGQAKRPFAPTNPVLAAFATLPQVDQQSQRSHRYDSHLGQTDLEHDQDADPGSRDSAKMELAATTGQPSSIGPAAPIGLAAAQISSQLKSGRDDPATEAGMALANTSQPSPPQMATPLVVATQPPAQIGSTRPDVGGEAGTGTALAKVSAPLPVSPVGTAKVAIAPASPSPKLASAVPAAKVGSGVAAPVRSTQMLSTPPAPAAKAVSPAAPPLARSQPAIVSTPREAPVVAVKPAAQPATHAGLSQRTSTASLGLEPIAFKLAPKAKTASPSAGLAAAKRAGKSARPALNSSFSARQARLPDRLVGEFILHQVSVRLNDSPAGTIDVRIGGDASLSVRVGSLLSVVKGQLDPGLFAAMNTSAGAEQYVSFRELRAAGIDVRYDPAGDTIVLTAP